MKFFEFFKKKGIAGGAKMWYKKDVKEIIVREIFMANHKKDYYVERKSILKR